jgi:hypothetical protein
LKQRKFVGYDFYKKNLEGIVWNKGKRLFDSIENSYKIDYFIGILEG